MLDATAHRRSRGHPVRAPVEVEGGATGSYIFFCLLPDFALLSGISGAPEEEPEPLDLFGRALA